MKKITGTICVLSKVLKSDFLRTEVIDNPQKNLRLAIFFRGTLIIESNSIRVGWDAYGSAKAGCFEHKFPFGIA